MLSVNFTPELQRVLLDAIGAVTVHQPADVDFHAPKGDEPARLVLDDVTFILYAGPQCRQFLCDSIRALSAALVWQDDVVARRAL